MADPADEDEMKDSAHEHKQALRAMLRQRMAELDTPTLRNQSVQACHCLIETDEFRRAEAIMIFLPLKHEVDAQPVAIRAWQMDKTVTVPRVGYEQRHMIPIEISSLGEPMDRDRHGVRTPVQGRPIPPEMIDLVVVPGLGFDSQGHRLGRGGGFYDRFLSQSGFVGKVCGLAIDDQVIDEVPTAGHDVMLDLLVTNQQVLRFKRSRK